MAEKTALTCTLPPMPAKMNRLWETIIKLGEAMPASTWMLVGGQMVMLRGLLAGRVMTRATNDIDVLADVLLPPAKANLSDCVRTIQQLGFKALDQAGSELLHRFVHPDGTYIDVLAPDHQSWAPVNVPPRETVRIPGGTQALQRAELVRVIKGEATAEIAVPALLGALVLKAAAFKPEKLRPERHVADAAFLTSLIADPIAVKEQFRGTDFARILYLNKELEDPQHPAWMDLGEHHEDALTAWRILCREPDNPQTHNGQ